ncbi:MAG: LysM peptidoglycan-binding domain-containing protein [Anaerolineales bacterium]|nr:LysM peptidoglycan-binding domain-containing protein [Anaerolineales bacterium]
MTVTVASPISLTVPAVVAAPAVTVTQPVAVAALAVDKPIVGANGFITVTGAGDPGEQVEVLEGGKIIGVATPSDDGIWQLVYRVDENGQYGFAVQQRDNVTTRTEPVTINVVNIPVAPAAVTAGAAVTPTVISVADAATASVEVETSVPAGAQTVADSLGGSEYVVESGDTLTSIADEYLGNPVLYTEIVAATNAMAAVDSSFKTITNPNLITVGDRLWIPTPGK